MLALTSRLVVSYVLHNPVSAEALPGLIDTVRQALAQPLAPKPTPVIAPVPALSAAQVQKSITPDALISFIDGKPYRTLSRHLTSRGLTADDYRRRYGLPYDYPMTAASYSARRSSLAKASGLGRGPGKKGVAGAPKPPRSEGG